MSPFIVTTDRARTNAQAMWASVVSEIWHGTEADRIPYFACGATADSDISEKTISGCWVEAVLIGKMESVKYLDLIRHSRYGRNAEEVKFLHGIPEGAEETCIMSDKVHLFHVQSCR